LSRYDVAMRLHLILPFSPFMALALGGCELVKNTGEVCVVPKDVMCDDHGCEGHYPADTAFEVEALLYEGGQGYSTHEKCTVEVDGHHLIVEGSFWHEREKDAIVEPPAVANCEVPPLAAGTWTLEFGGGEVEFEVGSDELQPMACAVSEDQHTH
jgi:hypothetical protein